MTTDSDRDRDRIVFTGRQVLRQAAGHLDCAAWLASHPEWAPIPGARHYEASHRGNGIRSLDRVKNGRQLTGKALSATVGSNGYPKVKFTLDDGTAVTRSVHTIVLDTHAGPCPDGQETLHGKGGPLDSRYCGCPAPECAEGNLRRDTKEANALERFEALSASGRSANGGQLPAPKPPRLCVRCGDHAARGRRCHACVVAIGVEAAELMRAGVTLEAANEQLEYGSPAYLHVLAVKYGGWGSCPHCQPQEAQPERPRRRFTVRSWRRRDAK